MNPLSGTELSTEAYSALVTLHNTINAGETADRSIPDANYASIEYLSIKKSLLSQ